MYHSPTSFVSTPDGPTEPFATTTGILQGGMLAPHLFVIVVDYILPQSIDGMNKLGLDVKPSKTNRDPAKFLTDLDYADDIALTSLTLQDAQQLLVSLEEASAKAGLLLNARAAQAWSACNRLPHIWQSNISVKTKIAFFKACVESILLYGSETWSMTKRVQENLDGTYTRLLVHHAFTQQRWLRKEELLRPQCPNRGRRPFSFLDSITRDLNIQLKDLPALMNDREEWREVVKNCSTK